MDGIQALIPILTDQSNEGSVRLVWSGNVSSSRTVPSHNLGVYNIFTNSYRNAYSFGIYVPSSLMVFFDPNGGDGSFKDTGTVISNVTGVVTFWLFSWT